MSRGDFLHEDQIVKCLKTFFYFDVVVNCFLVATLSSSSLCSFKDIIQWFVMPLPLAIGSKRHYAIWSSVQLSCPSVNTYSALIYVCT